MHRVGLQAATAVLLAASGCADGAPDSAGANPPRGAVSAEQWPTVTVPSTVAAKVQEAQTTWKNAPNDWRARLPGHEATGVYLNYSSGLCHGVRYRRDATGAVMTQVSGARGWFYDPVLISQCGLLAWGAWLRTRERLYLDAALAQGRKLIEMQDSAGALRYPFRWEFYDTRYQPGWTSGMAQGQALSLYARLYHATSDQAFAQAGAKALGYLLTPVSSGGVMTTLADLHPSLAGYVFYEEVVTQPKDNYILNGFMFTLLGLYDWSQVSAGVAADQQRARESFDSGIRTLERLLPYYDLGGMSAYDLTYITANNHEQMTVSTFYHVVHVHQLDALYDLTGRDVFRVTRDKWGKYLDDVARVGG
jgi:hypothetical protein